MLRRLACLIPVYIVCTACVSRYDPVEPINPLSGECRDYAGFSRALAVQRDHGFTRGATLSMAGYSVGSQQNREILYRQYKTVFDLIFTEYRISPVTAGVLGKVVCQQRRLQQWQELVSTDYKPVTTMILHCQQDNLAEVDREDCLVQGFFDYHNPGQ